MKRVVIAFLASAFLVLGLNASEDTTEIKGFFTSKWCAERGIFRNCPEETLVCGYEGCIAEWTPGEPMDTKLALYVHDTGDIYEVVLNELPRKDLDGAINRPDVTIIGQLDESTKTIKANDMKAPPPPKKSFFKGCL
jgi:hypothetical protein